MTTKEANKKIRAAKEILRGACWIGEDGDSACISKSKVGAWIKLRRLTRDDVGEYEASEIKIEDVGIGFLHLSDEDETDEWGEPTEWHISYSVPSPHSVFVHQVN